MRKGLTRFSDAFMGHASLPLIYLIPAIALCICLQLQITLFKHDDYLGLRANAADLLLPVLGILISVRILLKKDRWPQWNISHIYFWLAGLTLIITFCLFKGYQTTGEWNVWAVINKYIGWYVLMAYMGIGGWLASHTTQKWASDICSIFTGFWAFTLIVVMGRLIWFDLQGNTHQVVLNYPLDGFMGNRNAYAFISFSALALITALQIRKDPRPSWGFHLLWALMFLFYAYNASRAGLVILVFLVLSFFLLNSRFTCRHILMPLIAGAMAAIVFFSSFNSYSLQITRGHIQNSSQLIELGHLSPEEAKEKLDYIGDKVRIDTYGDAVKLWQTDWLTGGGLGSFRHYQTEKRGTFSDIIDCTSLWLLAETGIVGLLAFVSFFALALWKIFLKIRAGEDETGVYLGIFMMMLIFALMSLVHELMYTRFLWFFMGLALALPATERFKTHQA